MVDREKIEQKISELPDGIRDILEDKFKADFVSIEKIDEDKLIWKYKIWVKSVGQDW